MMQIQLILILLFAIFVAAFAIQNTMTVVIKFLFWEANLSLVLVILGAVAAGVLISFLISTLKQLGIVRERKEMHKQITALTKEKEELEKIITKNTEAKNVNEAASLEELDRIVGNGDAQQ